MTTLVSRVSGHSSNRLIARIALTAAAATAVVTFSPAPDATAAQATSSATTPVSSITPAVADVAKRKRKGAKRSSGRVFYVSPKGNDAAPGTSKNRALRTLAAASALSLRAGDQLLLERGARFTGTLTVTSSGTRRAPIQIGAYGRGKQPTVSGVADGFCVHLAGSYLTISAVRVHSCKVGVHSSGQNNVVREIVADHNMYGVEIADGANSNKVLDSRLVDNTTMAPNTPGRYDDYGANGVVVRGDRAEIARNFIAGHDAPSADFGRDGAAIEIYGAIGTNVHHNVAKENLAFTELGHSRSADTTYSDNDSYSSLPDATFLITRGAGDLFGPVSKTVAKRNKVVHTGKGSQGFWCGGDCTAATLWLESNTIYAFGLVGWVEGTIGGRNNTYGGGGTFFNLLPGDRFDGALRAKLAG